MVSLSHMNTAFLMHGLLCCRKLIAESYETAVYEILGLQLQMKADQYFPMALFIFL